MPSGDRISTNRGLSGIKSLVSNVDEAIGAAQTEKGSLHDEVPQREMREVVCSSSAPKVPNDNKSASGAKIVVAAAVCIVTIVGFLLYRENKLPHNFIATTANTTKPAQSVVGANEQTQDAVPNSVAANKALQRAEKRKPTRPVEVRPNKGTNLVLNIPQIRYCLSEEIRLTAIKSTVDDTSEGQVDRLNERINDYNARCGNFRYYPGDLETARSEIEQYRPQISFEGQRDF